MGSTAQGYCNSFRMPASILDDFSSRTSKMNLTFVGYEDLGGMWVTAA